MACSEEGLLARLEALLGAEAVRPSEGMVRGAAADGAVPAASPAVWPAMTAPGRQPGVWVSPADEEQVRELLAWATREKVPVYPRGGGTRWRAAFFPFRGGVGLDTRRLNRLLELDVENLTVVAGAGVTFAVLGEQLAPHRLFFPPESAWPAVSTLGGGVATNASGPRKYGYGSMHGYLLGCRVVFPAVAGGQFGGKQVKNVSGYDVSRFMCGLWGSLGVLTEVILKVRPVPEQCVVKVFTGTASRVLEASDVVRRGLYGVCGIEVLLGKAACWWFEGVGVQDPGGPPGVLIVGLEGPLEAVRWQSTWLEGLAGKHAITPWVEVAPAVAWDARRGVFDRAAREEASVWNMAVLPADLGPVIEEILDPALDLGQIGVAAHAGNGHAHLFLLPENSGSAAGDGYLERISSVVRGRGGYLVADDAAVADGRYEVLPARGTLAGVWRRLKEGFDPQGILSPAGRLSGGGVR